MAYAYVYAPVSGRSGPQETYCDGTTHIAPWCLGGSKPLDINTGGAVDAYLYVTRRLISRAVVSHCSGVCHDDTMTPWTYGVKVDLYRRLSDGDALVGTVGFGHLDDRVAQGTYDLGASPLRLGRNIASIPSCSCCYWSVHVHLQATGEAQHFGRCTEQSITGGMTWLYRWWVCDTCV